MRESSRSTGLIRIEEVDDAGEEEDGRYGASEEEEGLGCREMIIWFSAESCQNIVVFVDGLPKISSVLLIPPLAVGVAELAFLSWRINVTAILRSVRDPISPRPPSKCTSESNHIRILNLSLRLRSIADLRGSGTVSTDAGQWLRRQPRRGRQKASGKHLRRPDYLVYSGIGVGETCYLLYHPPPRQISDNWNVSRVVSDTSFQHPKLWLRFSRCDRRYVTCVLYKPDSRQIAVPWNKNPSPAQLVESATFHVVSTASFESTMPDFVCAVDRLIPID